jgi:hypothetical protein
MQGNHTLFIRSCFVCFQLFVFSLLAHSVSFSQAVPIEVEKLTVRPLDTVDAERVRIWIPIEGAYTCGVNVHIYDSSGMEVRYFLNTILQKGYHNFYWDKRDSVGNYVPSGVYSYKSTACNTVRTGKLEAVYAQWERECSIFIRDSTQPPEIVVETTRDSIRVSVTVLFGRGRVADEMMKDTLLMSGAHSMKWIPKLNLPPGQYRALLEMGDYKTETAFRYQP